MSTVDVTRAELALLVLCLNKAEARDKLCMAIHYGSKYLSNGQPGTAQNVDKSTSLASKVFRLFKSKNALLSTFLFLGQIGWPGTSEIYKNKDRADLIGKIFLYCWMGSPVCTTLVENAQYKGKVQKYNDRSLALVKAAMDIVVAAGLLQLAPKIIDARMTANAEARNL